MTKLRLNFNYTTFSICNFDMLLKFNPGPHLGWTFLKAAIYSLLKDGALNSSLRRRRMLKPFSGAPLNWLIMPTKLHRKHTKTSKKKTVNNFFCVVKKSAVANIIILLKCTIRQNRRPELCCCIRPSSADFITTKQGSADNDSDSQQLLFKSQRER